MKVISKRHEKVKNDEFYPWKFECTFSEFETEGLMESFRKQTPIKIHGKWCLIVFINAFSDRKFIAIEIKQVEDTIENQSYLNKEIDHIESLIKMLQRNSIDITSCSIKIEVNDISTEYAFDCEQKTFFGMKKAGL